MDSIFFLKSTFIFSSNNRYLRIFFLCSLIVILHGLCNKNMLFAQTGNAYTLFPSNGEIEVNTDTRLILTFENQAVLGNSGKIFIYDAATDQLVDSLDMGIPPGPLNNRTPSPYDTITYSSIPNTVYSVYEPDTDSTHVYQLKYIGDTTQADAFHFYPVFLNENVATICPHNNVLEYNKTYYIQIDSEVFPLEDNSFPGISGKTEWTFTTKVSPPPAETDQLFVSTDGSGDFSTIQGAIDYIPDDNPVHKTIFVKNGIYEEIIYFRNKENFTLLGEDRAKVIIQYANNGVFNYKDISPDPNLPGPDHYTRAVFAAHKSRDIKLINFTIISLGEPPAQAEGLLIKGERDQVHNVTIDGSGDALQASGTIYLSESSVKGFGDNVLGYGAVFFNRCEMISTYGPHLWVRNTDANHGNVFVNSILRTEGNVTVDIARAPTNHGIDYPYCEAVLINCKLEGVRSGGWGSVGPERENIHYWEYNSTNLEDGSSVDISNRVSYSMQLTMPEDSAIIANYSNPTFVLGGWTPEQIPMIFSESDTMRVNIGWQAMTHVNSAASPNRIYQWFKDGQILPDQTDYSLMIDSATFEDEGAYSVTVVNKLGKDSAYIATLLIDTTLVDSSAIDTTTVSDILIRDHTDPELKIYPNPAKDFITINREGTGHDKLIILNSSGQMVLVRKLDPEVHTIALPFLQQGIYFVRIGKRCKKLFIL